MAVRGPASRSELSASSEPRYSFRLPFGRERTYRLEYDAICWTDGRSEGRAVFGGITRVWLWHHPLAGHRCELRHSRGKILLLSDHFPSFRTREDRSATYKPFVCELMSRIAVGNPRAEFLAGPPWLLPVSLDQSFNLILLVVIFLPILLAISILDKWAATQTYLLLALNLLVALALWGYFRSKRRRRFDPRVLGPGELPE